VKQLWFFERVRSRELSADRRCRVAADLRRDGWLSCVSLISFEQDALDYRSFHRPPENL
jgi:hypothetical protein